jgi:hypothetical protein
MRAPSAQTLAGAITFLLEIGGAGVALEFPEFRTLGVIFMAVGVIPLLWWLVMAMEYFRRRHATAGSANLVWLKPLDAIAAFCDAEAVARWKDYQRDYREAYQKGHALNEEMSALLFAGDHRSGSFKGRPEDEAKYNELAARAKRYADFAGISDDGIKLEYRALRRELHDLLRSGKLIAQGYAEPHRGGQTEVQIRATEWEILDLHADGFAFRTNNLSAPVYLAVTVAQPAPTARAAIPSLQSP